MHSDVVTQVTYYSIGGGFVLTLIWNARLRGRRGMAAVPPFKVPLKRVWRQRVG
jgi:hypothetical protein